MRKPPTPDELRKMPGSSLLRLFLAFRDSYMIDDGVNDCLAEIDRRLAPDVMVTMNTPQAVADTERAPAR